jgi:hypothetical protein
MPLLPVLRAVSDPSQIPPARVSAGMGSPYKNWSLSHGSSPAPVFSNRDKLFWKQRFDNLSEYRNGLKINRLRIVKSVAPLL